MTPRPFNRRLRPVLVPVGTVTDTAPWGVGTLIFDAILNRDLMVVKNVVLLFAAIVVVVNLMVDILYAMVDPRIRIQT